MHQRSKHLLSLPFLFCLILLILNDFVLKNRYHNVLTGKLSDFCGLFVFTVFWSAVFPRHKASVFIATVLLFTWWKSEYASGFVEILNKLFRVQRVVDPTDLLALAVLLPAWFYLKHDRQIRFPDSLVTRLGALFASAVTIFSFCATSQQRYIQSFEQPQYVLLRSDKTPNANLYNDLEFFKAEGLLVVRVNQLYISKPVRDDDYNKNLSIAELDREIHEWIGDSTSLIPEGETTRLTIKTTQGDDALSFNGSRLDGPFTRTKNEKVIIEGHYKMGLEDSTWTIRDSLGNRTVVHTFLSGERTNTRQFDGSKLVSNSSVNTRTDTIRNTYLHIFMLVLCTLAVVMLLIRNYRSTQPAQLSLMPVWKWLLCFILPSFIWVSHVGMRLLIQDFNQDIFETLATVIFIFITTCPLMFVIVFWVKFRKEVDILLYCLLFGLIVTIWTTCGTLMALSA
ncbi:hypothetical protein [Pedobacter sp. SYP-B3415]|uniref:hypothetical protein n=1 Tax=Pedobacter sp. SYP-B3415 TaxID=2496641 RepID=UPI00101DB513|nr:hypothetical protein [Pedobacter sp. SYP-B3415]